MNASVQPNIMTHHGEGRCSYYEWLLHVQRSNEHEDMMTWLMSWHASFFVNSWTQTNYRWAPRHTNIIHAFAKVSQHGSAVEWLDVMEEAHHSPNVLSYTCAIEVGRWDFGLETKPLNRWIFWTQACLWATAWDEALGLLQRMQKQGEWL